LDIKVKSRKLPYQFGKAVLRSYGGYNSYQTASDVILGTEVTRSENHHKPPFRGTGDEGGEFFNQKKYVEGPSPIRVRSHAYDTLNKADVFYDGPVFPMITPWDSLFPPALNSSDLELTMLGTDAIARTKPTNSVANLAVTLAEVLREGIPRATFSLWEERTRLANLHKAAGDDWLNAQFGWKPLVSDVESVANGITRADEIIRQYERDAGGVVRRRWQFPEKRKSEVLYTENSSNSRPWINPGHFLLLTPNSPGGYSVIREFSQKRWFSAAFTYYLPSDWNDLRSMRSIAAKADHLLGVDITPEVLWNLTPWSWAADWFTSTGSVISNLTDMADQSLLLRYGYLMEHTLVKDTYTRTYDVPPLKEMSPPVTSHSVTFVTETKLRKRADPYGFGVSFDSLTDLQKSIIAALGLSRSRR